MGKYDDISEKRLRADLKRFAELILRLEEEGGLLTSPSDLLTILGELRQKLFAYEVRCSHLRRDGESEAPSPEEADGVREDPSEPGSTDSPDSERIVREARRREEEMIREWLSSPDAEDDHGR
jgi:hypothetical protein